MRLLFFTDTHLRSTTPESRTDDMVETMKKKLSEIVEIANGYSVTAVIHGGDLFDMPSPGLGAMGDLVGIFNRLQAPVYIINGNHDIYGHNISTLSRTLLGFLIAMGSFTILSRQPVYVDDGNVRVQLTGAGYHYDIDDDPSSYVVSKKNCDIAIHVAHGMLLDKAVFPGGNYTLIDDVKDRTEADITLVGHYHMGFDEVVYNGKYFFNPGSVVRLSSHPAEMRRLPQVLLLDLNGRIDYRYIKLKCARPGPEVLDRTKIEQAHFRAEKRAYFLQEIRAAAGTSRKDPYGILEEVIKDRQDSEGLSREVVDEVRRRFAEAEAMLKGGV
ncbi:metallophosphoesterase family protein [Caldanaerobius polysaccharolyticus]|uniref:metallophosphoesterase family protein n=1 Tax=Caldanaerobius polysaccharolyticus TaxID=44256 RepID=UPI00047B03F3|nr:metallophosphoesterase family protein [Caldanaerobius polysaccharolyticus]